MEILFSPRGIILELRRCKGPKFSTEERNGESNNEIKQWKKSEEKRRVQIKKEKKMKDIWHQVEIRVDYSYCILICKNG